ncbi:MAG: class I SAM-dependent methyltransferase [Planctomycetes bacterium]|nr:class I SAM-dependent methyltransferase [Planctomycetota bacterium]
MSLSAEYGRQAAWRDWPSVFGALPALAGSTVIDLGCAIGDVSAEFVRRGASVVGVDGNAELLHTASSRSLARASFRLGDLRRLDEPDASFDGAWSSFSCAYFVDLQPVLREWLRVVRPGGWLALVEIDDLFGHEPLAAEAREALAAYAREALAAGRYDFSMGSKLAAHAEGAGLRVVRRFTLVDRELAFDGPADAAVLDAWRARFDRMRLLRDACGPRFEAVRDAFLACLAAKEHRARASVRCVIAER